MTNVTIFSTIVTTSRKVSTVTPHNMRAVNITFCVRMPQRLTPIAIFIPTALQWMYNKRHTISVIYVRRAILILDAD